jgi:acetolactate synthase-1/2/3 large subunit
MTGSESGAARIATEFGTWGVSHVYCVPGADISVLLEALEAEDSLRIIYAAHEIAAGAMADGYARRAGRPGVAVSIGGPGASYLAAAAAAAARDSSPVLFVTGSPKNGSTSAPDWPDDEGSFTAAGALSTHCGIPDGLEGALEKVKLGLATGRVAHLRVSLSEQRAFVVDARRRPPGAHARMPRHSPTAMHGRVALAVGAGALEHADGIRDLAESHRIPIATDMLSRGIIAEDEKLSLGHLGFMPHPRARAATDGCDHLAADLVIALGAQAPFERTLRSGGVTVESVPGPCIGAWLCAGKAQNGDGTGDREAWTLELAQLGRPAIPAPSAALGHDVIVCEVATELGPSAIHVIDAGHFHQIAAARLVARQPRTILTASELASMGWAIGAAIGAKCASPDDPVVAYIGDGSFMMHGLELATAARYQIPVLFVIAANGVYGSVRRGARRGESALLGPADPARIAGSCGVETWDVSDRAALQEALRGCARLKTPRVIVARVPELDDAAVGLPTGLDWLDRPA